MLKDIEAAGGTINKAVDSTMKQSAQIVQAEFCLLYTSRCV